MIARSARNACWPVLVLVPWMAQGAPPPELRPWLELPQAWARDTQGPVISLGDAGEFDDTHIFAPAVALEDGEFKLWYCGSRGAVRERVFRLGLATSPDGRSFQQHADQPVYEFGDGKHSILTPALLRRPDGATLREEGKLRLWFSSTWFAGESGLHTLHETPNRCFDPIERSPGIDHPVPHPGFQPVLVVTHPGVRQQQTHAREPSAPGEIL